MICTGNNERGLHDGAVLMTLEDLHKMYKLMQCKWVGPSVEFSDLKGPVGVGMGNHDIMISTCFSKLYCYYKMFEKRLRGLVFV